MTIIRRRDFLGLGATAGIGLGLRAAITGLPISFLLRGEAHAQGLDGDHRIAILASSSAGEPINVCGPGTFAEAFTEHFSHPDPRAIDASEVIPQTVNGMRLGVESESSVRCDSGCRTGANGQLFLCIESGDAESSRVV